jgi:hypothetical protein
MGAIEMRTILLLLVAVVVLLVATNPTRGEFNDWIMQYAAQKVRDDARAQKRDVSWGERMVGGYSTGWVISKLPVARSNYLVFSIYRVDLPQDVRGEFPGCVIAVAGQFIPRNSC